MSMDEALADLMARVDAGEEFPDATSKVATKHRVDYDELRKAYDRADREREGLRPCRSPYCECERGQCTHPGFFDARGT